MKPLQFPKDKRVKSLYIYCYQCKTNVDKICKEAGKHKDISQCPFGERHKFKVYVHQPGTKNKRRTMILETRNINEAIRQAVEFQKLVRGEMIPNRESIPVIAPTAQRKEVVNNPDNLSDSIDRYTDWLADKEVPEHLKRNRSESHVKDVKHQFEMLKSALAFHSIDPKLLSVHDFDDEIVGKIYKFLRVNKGYSNRSVNKIIGNFKSFFKWFPEQYNVPVRNGFNKVKKLPEKYNQPIVSFKEFETLIGDVKPENGWQTYESGVKQRRNFYRPYLVSVFKWGIHGGMRTEELINLKHSHIKEKEGHAIIRIPNLKVNRIQGREAESEKVEVIIPVTEDIERLLSEANYEHLKNSDAFIIAPEITENRVNTMRSAISRGFSHFYNISHPEGGKTFKALRKTYLTHMNKYLGNEATDLTHSNQAVLDKHYLNKEKLAEKALGFGTFNEEIRQADLNNVRTSKSHEEKKLGHELDK
ncbi:MAG: hypothetical protein M3Q95_08015 [Bacteroidota bacterium]|nr:hypothetical protein [Bacteroidota bacterium]